MSGNEDATSLKYWISKIPEFTFSPKRPYGNATYGKLISYLQFKGQRVRIQIGDDPNPLPDENGNVNVDPKKLVKTHFGISIYQPKSDEDNLSSTTAPGVASNQYTQPSFPQPGQQPVSSGGNENTNRRTLDIQVHPDNELFFEFCRLFDERVKRELELRCKEFFDRDKISLEMLEDKYKGILSESKSGSIRYLNGKVDINRCDIRKALLKRKVRKATHDEVEKYSFITPCIEFTGIYFSIEKKSVRSVNVAVNVPSLLIYESQPKESFTVQLPAGYSIENSSEEDDSDSDNTKNSSSKKRKRTSNSNASSSSSSSSSQHKKQKQEESDEDENANSGDENDDTELMNLPGDAASLVSQNRHGFPQ